MTNKRFTRTLLLFKEDGFAIAYSDNPSEEVQLEAVKQNGYAISYIHNPSEKIIRYLLDNYSSKKEIMQVFLAKIGEEGYNKLSDEDKLKLELLD